MRKRFICHHDCINTIQHVCYVFRVDTWIYPWQGYNSPDYEAGFDFPLARKLNFAGRGQKTGIWSYGHNYCYYL